MIACKVYAKLEPGLVCSGSESQPAKNWIFLSPADKKSLIDSIPSTIPFGRQPQQLFDIVEQLYADNGLDERAKKRALEIIQLINSKKELGVPVSELPHLVVGGRSLEDGESCRLERHMTLLTENQVVLRTGLLAARYVGFEFAHPWVVQSF